MKVKLRKENQDRKSYKKYLETFDNETLRDHQEILKNKIDNKFGWFNEDKGHKLKLTPRDLEVWGLMSEANVDISMIISDRKIN